MKEQSETENLNQQMRALVEKIKTHEKKISDLCVKHAELDGPSRLSTSMLADLNELRGLPIPITDLSMLDKVKEKMTFLENELDRLIPVRETNRPQKEKIFRELEVLQNDMMELNKELTGIEKQGIEQGAIDPESSDLNNDELDKLDVKVHTGAFDDEPMRMSRELQDKYKSRLAQNDADAPRPEEQPGGLKP